MHLFKKMIPIQMQDIEFVMETSLLEKMLLRQQISLKKN
ncbi:uncharacterized protein METZ01_LOCUS35364 [marine metagenome]|uniref:Uncharacterized protein n=1 Tax=marine metagenome TaxID=408172 RepID=A0A381QTR1_9ZZZZ